METIHVKCKIQTPQEKCERVDSKSLSLVGETKAIINLKQTHPIGRKALSLYQCNNFIEIVMEPDWVLLLQAKATCINRRVTMPLLHLSFYM